MPNALILSSHVAGSRVGGTVQTLALAQLGIEPILVPSVLFGRHPGWGPPGGAATPVEVFEGMLDGVEANGLLERTDLVLTGYLAGPGQVRAAARAIEAVRAAPRAEGERRPIVVVDPIMGDSDKGLYVAPETADAIAGELAPLADYLTPNAWEAGRLTGLQVKGWKSALRAARALGRPALVTSVEEGGELGVVYADGSEAWLAAHARLPDAPKGPGDLLAALFGAALLEGQPPSYALARAVGGVLETVAAAGAAGARELPVLSMGAKLRAVSPSVRIERAPA
jgi:pyridoxine kinase